MAADYVFKTVEFGVVKKFMAAEKDNIPASQISHLIEPGLVETYSGSNNNNNKIIYK